MIPTLPSTQIETPLGLMLAVASEAGLVLLEFLEPGRMDAQVARLCRTLSCAVLPGSSPWFEPVRWELAAYFSGRRMDFSIPLDCPGTPFQRDVWQALRQIPYGETRTYGQLAQTVGRPRAARAVGAANGRNPVAVMIPCHRLVGPGGRLTGYGGGLWRKRYLLDLESARR